MSQSINVSEVLTRIRNQADIETADQANSRFTTTMLTDWLNQAYKALFDVIVDDTPAAEGHFGTSATLTPSAFTLPSDFYRALGIDYAPGGITTNATYFEFARRNANNLIVTQYPQFRVRNGAIVWSPSAPTTSVTLWYIPVASTLSSTFNAFNGWDDYITQWVVRQVKLNQEYDISDVQLRLNEAERRVRRASKRMAPYQDPVEDARGGCFDTFFNG